MKLTVIAPDKVVIKDGEAYPIEDLSYLDANIHAIQWQDTTGEIEYKDATPNLIISDITPYNKCVTDWEAVKTKELEKNLLSDEEYEKWFREKRNTLLLDCDWTQFTDSPLTDTKKTEWQTYRQALRDMPTTKTTTYKELAENTAHSDYPSKPS